MPPHKTLNQLIRKCKMLARKTGQFHKASRRIRIRIRIELVVPYLVTISALNSANVKRCGTSSEGLGGVVRGGRWGGVGYAGVAWVCTGAGLGLATCRIRLIKFLAKYFIYLLFRVAQYNNYEQHLFKLQLVE